MSIFKHNDDDYTSDMSASESDSDEPTQYGGGIPRTWLTDDSMTTTTRQVFIIFFQLVNAWPSKRNGQVVSPSSLTIISLASLLPSSRNKWLATTPFLPNNDDIIMAQTTSRLVSSHPDMSDDLIMERRSHRGGFWFSSFGLSRGYI